MTVTNTRQTGELVVTKVIEGEVAGASTTFPIAVDCDVDAYDTTFDLTVPAAPPRSARPRSRSRSG